MINNSNWRGETNDEQVFRDTSSKVVDRVSRDFMLGGNGLDMGASICIFWCACAHGALVTGRLNNSTSRVETSVLNIIQLKSTLMTAILKGTQKVL